MGYNIYWFQENIIIFVLIFIVFEGINWGYVVGVVVFILVVVIFVLLYYVKKKWVVNRVLIEVLIEKECVVVKVIFENGGIIKQEEFLEFMGYLCLIISRIIQEFEKKQFVECEKIGKIFIVKLMKEIIMCD